MNPSRNTNPSYSLLVIFSGFFAASITACLNVANNEYCLSQILFVRYFPLALISYSLLKHSHVSIKTPNALLTTIRCLCGIGAVVLFIEAAQNIPVINAQTMYYTAPLFTSLFFCLHAFNQKRSVWLKILPLIPLGFFGVLLVNRPSFSEVGFGYSSAALLSALFLSLASLSLKGLGKRGEPSERTIFYFSLTFPSHKIVEEINRVYPIEPLNPNYTGEVATRWAYKDGSGELGFISSVSEPFCKECSRIRLSVDGKLYKCLFATEGFDIRQMLRGGASDEEIEDAIGRIWTTRDENYSEIRTEETVKARAGKRIEMSYIGG